MSACLQPSFTPPPVAVETRSTPLSRSKSTATTGTVRLEDLRAGLTAVAVQVCGRTSNQLRFGCTFVRPSRVLEAFGGTTKGRERERERKQFVVPFVRNKVKEVFRSTELKRCQRAWLRICLFCWSSRARLRSAWQLFFSSLFLSFFVFALSQALCFGSRRTGAYISCAALLTAAEFCLARWCVGRQVTAKASGAPAPAEGEVFGAFSGDEPPCVDKRSQLARPYILVS